MSMVLELTAENRTPCMGFNRPREKHPKQGFFPVLGHPAEVIHCILYYWARKNFAAATTEVTSEQASNQNGLR